MLNDPQNYSYESIQKLISTLEENEKRMACLAYGTGARVSELNQIKKKDFHQESNYLQITCPVLKKRDNKQHIRLALIRLDEIWLIEPIQKMLENLSDEEVLLPYHRATIYKKLTQSVGINPHGFRKLRATHLVVKFKFNGQQLKHFFDWSRSDMADNYIKLNTKDIEY